MEQSEALFREESMLPSSGTLYVLHSRRMEWDAPNRWTLSREGRIEAMLTLFTWVKEASSIFTDEVMEKWGQQRFQLHVRILDMVEERVNGGLRMYIPVDFIAFTAGGINTFHIEGNAFPLGVSIAPSTIRNRLRDIGFKLFPPY